jgi:hypothetical protein
MVGQALSPAGRFFDSFFTAAVPRGVGAAAGFFQRITGEDMDLKTYYQKIRDIAAKIPEVEVVVVSAETADGGKAGLRMEVPRHLAAKLLVDGRACLAVTEAAAAFRAEVAEAAQVAQKLAQASKLQIAVLSSDELNRLKGNQTKE